jgi:dipeptidase E
MEYALPLLEQHYEGVENILFIPFACPSGLSHHEYTKRFSKAMSSIGKSVKGAHDFSEPEEAIKEHEAIFIGGGNTFLLLNDLHKFNWFYLIKNAVEQGMPYAGSSAGSNVAGRTIGTTNDMPIIYPPTFEAFGFVPFNINPHYLDPDPNSKHMGETRETRINEFHTQNLQPVLGLREGDTLIVLGDQKKVDHMRKVACNDHRTLTERVIEYDYLEALGIPKPIRFN